MPEQKKIIQKGGTMRLGAYACKLKRGSLASKAYHRVNIYERHRHRYEFNNEYLKEIERHGMVASGINPQSGLVEVMEITDHPFFLGVQYHPELKSTVENPHPLFVSFVRATVQYKRENS